jgi:hypothetical protein
LVYSENVGLIKPSKKWKTQEMKNTEEEISSEIEHLPIFIPFSGPNPFEASIIH